MFTAKLTTVGVGLWTTLSFEEITIKNRIEKYKNDNNTMLNFHNHSKNGSSGTPTPTNKTKIKIRC